MANTPRNYFEKLKLIPFLPRYRERSLVKNLQRKIKSHQIKLQKYKIANKELAVFERAVSTFPLPILVMDESRIRYVNTAWEKRTGYRLHEVIGMKSELFEKDSSPDEIKWTIKEMIKKKKTFKAGEYTTINKKGKDFDSYTVMFPLMLGKSKVFYAVLYHDITLMQDLEDATSLLNRRIIHILNSISDGFISLDKNWKITYLNKQAEMILRTKKEAAYGKPVWKIIPGYKKNELHEKFMQAVEDQEIAECTIRFDGDKWYLVRFYPSYDNYSLYFYDKTIEKEKDLNKDDFIGIASHEIKTPVTSIKAYAQIIKKQLLKQKNNEILPLVEKMDEQVLRLQALIDDLLDVNRIQVGKLTIKKSEFPVAPVINGIVENCKRLNSTHTFVLRRMMRGTIYADKEKISEVLLNLCSNAVKYSPKGGTIELNIYKKNKDVIFSITDQGIGIPDAMKEKIFERFTRIEHKQYQISGLGLGLYICAEIIKQHEGQIWVESEVGKGSTFYFSIPPANEKKVHKEDA